MLIVMGAVLAGDAGVLTGLTMAVCSKLRRIDAEPEYRRAPSDTYPTQRLSAWPRVSGNRRPLPGPETRHVRDKLLPVGSATGLQSHSKVIEPPSPSIAHVTERLVAEFRTRVPLVTIVATVRQTRFDLAWITGQALPAAVERAARKRLIELVRAAGR
jgi:hypothetical protein